MGRALKGIWTAVELTVELTWSEVPGVSLSQPRVPVAEPSGSVGAGLFPIWVESSMVLWRVEEGILVLACPVCLTCLASPLSFFACSRVTLLFSVSCASSSPVSSPLLELLSLGVGARGGGP